MTQGHGDLSQRALAKWRHEARLAIPGADDDVVEEVAQHLASRWERLHAAGAAEGDADAILRSELAQWRDVHPPVARQSSSARGWGGDARYALRSIRSRPFFALSMILLAAMAAAADLAAFVIVYGLLYRSLAYPDAERLAVLWQVQRGEQGQVSYPDYRDLTRASVFDAAAAMSSGRASVRIGDRIERVNVLGLERAGYAMLGARPVRGRLLLDEDGGQPTVLVSHRLWTTQLNSDPAVVGRLLWISGRNYTVAGVLAPGFDFELPVTSTLILENHDIWTMFDVSEPATSRRDISTYQVLARLAPGATIREAQAAVDAIGQRLARTHAQTNESRTFRVAGLKDEVVGRMRQPLVLVAVAAVVTFTIAIANLATLALVRLSERQPELAIRAALGAGTRRLRRQLLVENLLLSVIGTSVGSAGAVYVVYVLASSNAAHLPRADAIRFDTPALLFAAALAMLIAGALTALPVRFTESAALLRGARGAWRAHARRFRRSLVAAEVALALALSTGGALLGLSLVRLFSVDPGFTPRGVLAMRASAYPARYPELRHVTAFFDSVVDAISRMPAVTGVGAGSSLPLSGQTTGTSVVAAGQPVPSGSRQSGGWQFVTAGYFGALGMRMKSGREFEERDGARPGHVTIVNESLARTLFGAADPVGRKIAVGDGDAVGDWHEIVGVVADVRHHAINAPPDPRIYDLFGEHWGRTMYLVVRVGGADAASMVPAIRRAVAAHDPDVPLFEISTMDELLRRSAAPRTLSVGLATALAGTALVLALIGTYAVAAASVAERTREIGIRAALGASRGDLLRLVVGENLSMSAAGAVFGLAGSLVGAKLMAAQLFGVEPRDVVVLIPIVVAAVAGSTIAAVLPAAFRATTADPLTAIRAE